MAKKRIVINYLSLSPELKELFRKTYPNGPEASLIRVDKGNGDFLCGVVLETEEISYFVKLAVKVDEVTDDFDKDFYEEEHEIKGVEDLIEQEENED